MTNHSDYCFRFQATGRGACICKPGIAQDIDPRDCWGTPDDLYRALDREFNFEWDLAADKDNAKCYQFISAEQDSLTEHWHKLRGWLFLNPPFSDLVRFMFKCWKESRLGAKIVVVFPSNRFDRGWMHDYVIDRALELRVSRGRPNYDPPSGVDRSHPEFGTCVAIFDSIGPATTIIRSLKY